MAKCYIGFGYWGQLAFLPPDKPGGAGNLPTLLSNSYTDLLSGVSQKFIIYYNSESEQWG